MNKPHVYILALTLGSLLPRLAAQAPAASAAPVADALRDYAKRSAQNLVAAAEEMPADKYGFKPTPAQMSFADVVVHLAEGNDFFCGKIAGVSAPQRDSVAATAPKEKLVARLRETFQFCDSALAKVDDANLAEQGPLFGNRPSSRARTIIITVADWADHYSQVAIYLRLNGLLPPTAKRPAS